STDSGKGAGLVKHENGLTGEQAYEGAANLRAMSADTAAALETLAASNPVLTGYAGDTHTLDTTPYINRSNLTIYGNGATLYNSGASAIGDDAHVLPLGTSNLGATDDLTFYTIASSAGRVITSTGNGGNFAAGDI